MQDRYEAQENRKDSEMILLWWKAWELFQKIIETAEYKISVSGIMEFCQRISEMQNALFVR